MKELIRKFRIDDPVCWDNHRGGWSYVLELLTAHFSSKSGVLLLSAIEEIVQKGEKIDEPWVGFIHQLPENNLKRFPDLERILCDKVWINNLRNCKGIYTISPYIKEYLDGKQLPVEVNTLYYPIDMNFLSFDIDVFISKPKRLIFIGEYMRNFQSFFDLKAPGYEKIMLSNETFRRAHVFPSSDVKIMDRLSDGHYDEMLAGSIVFLDLIDAPANTTVVECIGRNTPLLINRLPGVEDYLGTDYPFYYATLEEAAMMLTDMDLIKETYAFLSNLKTKEKLTADYFIQSMYHSTIYEKLNKPSLIHLE